MAKKEKKSKKDVEKRVDIDNVKLQYRAYCTKCKKKDTFIANAMLVKKSNRYRVAGECPVCGTKVSVFTSSERFKERMAKIDD